MAMDPVLVAVEIVMALVEAVQVVVTVTLPLESPPLELGGEAGMVVLAAILSRERRRVEDRGKVDAAGMRAAQPLLRALHKMQPRGHMVVTPVLLAPRALRAPVRRESSANPPRTRETDLLHPRLGRIPRGREMGLLHLI